MLLKKDKEMLHSTLENYTGTEYKIELLEAAQLCHAKQFSSPNVHEETLKIKVD